MQHALETVRILKSYFKDEVYVRGNCDQSPFSLATMVRTPTHFLMDLMLDEENAVKLLHYTTKISKQLIDLMARTGADMLSNGDSPAGPDMISIGMDAVELDYKISVHKIYDVMHNRCTLFGTVDPSGILALATPDKVEEKTIELNDVVHPFYLITAIMIVSGFVSFFLPLPEVTAEGEVQDQTQTPLAADLGSRSLLAKANGVMWYPSEVDVSIRPGWYYHASEDCQVKTPQKLIDIYYSSIGKNSLLLLNMPPDKRGLIHENDRHSLLAMKRILQQTFAHNYMSDIKKTTLSSVEQKELTDDALETY